MTPRLRLPAAALVAVRHGYERKVCGLDAVPLNESVREICWLIVAMDGQIESRQVGTGKDETRRELIIHEDTSAASDGRNLFVKF